MRGVARLLLTITLLLSIQPGHAPAQTLGAAAVEKALIENDRFSIPRGELARLLAAINDQAALERVADNAKDPAVRLIAATRAGKKTWADVFSDVLSKSAPKVVTDQTLDAILLMPPNNDNAKRAARHVAIDLIRRADAARVDDLIELLNLPGYADAEMVGIYRGCEHPPLRLAAERWLRSNFKELTFGRTPDVRWGRD